MKFEKAFSIPQNIFKLGVAPAGFVVMCYLIKCSDKNGKCFPSLGVIADNCGLAKSTVQGALKKLVSFGLVKKEKRFLPATKNRIRQTSNNYYLNLNPGYD